MNEFNKFNKSGQSRSFVRDILGEKQEPWHLESNRRKRSKDDSAAVCIISRINKSIKEYKTEV